MSKAGKRAWLISAWLAYTAALMSTWLVIGAQVSTGWVIALLDIAAMPVVFLVVDSLMGVLRGLFSWPEYTWHTNADYLDSLHRYTVVSLPGVANKVGYITAAYQLLFDKLGERFNIDYPHFGGVWTRLLVRRILRELNRQVPQRPVIFFVQSSGALVAAEVMRRYKGKVVGFISDSSPAAARDAKPPAPLWLMYLVQGGPLSEPLWRRLMWYQDKKGEQSNLPYGKNKQLYDLHHAAVMNCPPDALIGQTRTLLRLPRLKPGEFPDVPALLFYTQRSDGGEDVFIKTSQAQRAAEAAFPDHTTVMIYGGLHANVVELADQYWNAMSPWLQELDRRCR